MTADDTFSQKIGHGSKLSRKKELVIAALLRCKNHAEVAKECGVSLSSIARFLRDPAFSEQYRRAKNQLVEDATAQLRVAGGRAVETLILVAGDGKSPPAARVSASRAILEFMLHAHELDELDERMRRLEGERSTDDAEF
jgi:DNA-binding MurR/RpiR family transcriptional regulator